MPQPAVFIDMASNYPKSRIMQQRMGDMYNSEYSGLDLLHTNWRTHLDNEDNSIPATILADRILRSRQRHGERMSQVYTTQLTELGWETDSIDILPLPRGNH